MAFSLLKREPSFVGTWVQPSFLPQRLSHNKIEKQVGHGRTLQQPQVAGNGSFRQPASQKDVPLKKPPFRQHS